MIATGMKHCLSQPDDECTFSFLEEHLVVSVVFIVFTMDVIMYIVVAAI